MTNDKVKVYKFSMNYLQELVNDYGDIMTKEGSVDLQSDCDIEYFLSEMNSIFRGILKSECDFWVEAKKYSGKNWVNWSTSSYEKIEFWTKIVDECYEGILVDTNLWSDFFGFGGDDDVDYNSSYIWMVNLFIKKCEERGLLVDYEIGGECRK